MSAGSFIKSRYQTDGGEILRCRVQPETELLTDDGTVFNSAPVAAATLPWSLKLGKNRQELGLHPRRIRVIFDQGTAPATYKQNQVLDIPIMTKAAFDAFITKTAFEYLNAPCTLVGFTNEFYN